MLDSGRHELSCAACGAPLHEMKALRQDRAATALRHKPKAPPHPVTRGKPGKKSGKKKKAKRRKSLFSKFIEEVVDVIEDVID